MDGVLAGHADDIVMFDVPPPEDGIRGIEAYREIWPPFFEWQRHGATFEIVSLTVTAGAEVAFAHALLRCGTAEEFKQDPDNRLRLTIGLQGGWPLGRGPRAPLISEQDPGLARTWDPVRLRHAGGLG